jgi:sugar/nucleoside kinase (ribokinase family)
VYPETPLVEVADRLLNAGTAAVVVTASAAGAYVWTPAGEHRVPALRSTVVDTVGAGDSFMSGQLSEMRAGQMPVEGAALFGARRAAVTVSRRGSDPPGEEGDDCVRATAAAARRPGARHQRRSRSSRPTQAIGRVFNTRAILTR